MKLSLAFVLAVFCLTAAVAFLPSRTTPAIEIHAAARHDTSAPLALLRAAESRAVLAECPSGCGVSDLDFQPAQQTAAQQTRPNPGSPPVTPPPPIPPAGLAVEQHEQGARPGAVMVASFDGLGVGFEGPQGAAVRAGRGGGDPVPVTNPSDNSLAVGPNHIVQTVNGGFAVFTRKGTMFETTGRVLYGSVPTKTVFQGFGGACEAANFGDVVVRYDQLAERWLYVMPIFQKIPGRDAEPYSVCYAISKDADPLGPYHRYEFRRKLFPDYPRPAIWTDGYYTPSSTGDTVVQKHTCIADRSRMLKGEDATEQCLIIEGVNFLNNADIDGRALPPPGAPNIMLAAGGTQLKGMSENDDKYFQDDGIYAWKVHVDWQNPANTAASGPVKIAVAPYHYLCNGQLSACVPQPGTDVRLDSQGDKLMERLTYRNFGDHQSLVVTHSVNSSPGKAGGVRWYEFRIDGKGDPALYQQGTYAPDEYFRWMASAAMDRAGNIGIGYSFGGSPNFPGQRFAARMAGDPLGKLTVRESVLVNGEYFQSQSRWEDYTQLHMDPVDDCTFWYVGDYVRTNAVGYSTRIGAFRLPGCLQRRLNGSAFLDLNHDGKRDGGEPGVPGVTIAFGGGKASSAVTDAKGDFHADLPADPIFQMPTYTVSAQSSSRAGWMLTGKPLTVSLMDAEIPAAVNVAVACTAPVTGGAGPKFWAGGAGKSILSTNDPAWRELIRTTVHQDFAYADLKKWLGKPGLQQELASLALSVNYGSIDRRATVQDPVSHDWVSLRDLIGRVAALTGPPAEAYRDVLERLNNNTQPVTPSTPASCGSY